MCAPSFLEGAYLSWGSGMLMDLSVICTDDSDFPSSSGSPSAANGLEKDVFDR